MGISPLTSLISLKGAQVDSATETEGEGGTEKGREGGGRGICCHGERFFKQLLIRLCCSAPLSILLLSLSLLCVTASRSGKRFVRYAVGCGPSCFRPFTQSATRRDGRLCLPDTGRGYWQVRKDILTRSSLFLVTHRIFMLQCVWMYVGFFFSP